MTLLELYRSKKTQLSKKELKALREKIKPFGSVGPLAADFMERCGFSMHYEIRPLINESPQNNKKASEYPEPFLF